MRFVQSSRRSSSQVFTWRVGSVHVVTVLILADEGYNEGFSHFESLRPTCVAVDETALASTPPPVLVAGLLLLFLK